MSNILALTLFFASFALGIALSWALFRSRLRQAIANTRLEMNAEQSVLLERLQARDLSLNEAKQNIGNLDEKLNAASRDSSNLQKHISTLEEQLRNTDEKFAFLEKMQVQFSDAFKALSSDALKSNNQSFLELAKTTLEKFQDGAKGDLETRQKAIDSLVKPLQESLEKVDLKIHAIEKDRSASFATLSEQIKAVTSTQVALKDETANLVKALRTPHVRGRWGEIQLRKVVEMAGMLEHCDFVEQQTANDSALRPDMIIKLPNNKNIVLDSKVPLHAFLEMVESSDDETRNARLQDHARHVQTHISRLSQKSYWDQFDPTPDFVVLFLPGENIYSAALQANPALIEVGAMQRVVIATPTTLIALLRVVAFGWSQDKLAQTAQEISELAKALYDRMATTTQHLEDLRKNLERSVVSYNNAIGSLESRVLPSMRRFKELGMSSASELKPTKLIERHARSIEAIEISAESAVITQEAIE